VHCCTRGPLRPVHAPPDAHGSSKPQGRSGLLPSRLEGPPPQSPYVLSPDRQLVRLVPGRPPVRSLLAMAPACAAAMVIGAQLALRFRFLPAGELHQLTCPRQRSFRSRGTRPRIRPVQSGRPAGGASHAARRFLFPFGHRHWLFRHVAPASGILPSLPPAYRPPPRGRTLSGFPRSPRPRYGRVGCPLYAGDGGALPAGPVSPAGTRRLRQRPVPEPRCRSHLAGLSLTTHQRGFKFFTLPAFSLPVPPG
jgi:hypothetical protein